jgi:hypothetical protein
VPAYQARHIAKTTRQLNAIQTRLVDDRIAPALGAVSFGRLDRLLEPPSSTPIQQVPSSGPH